MMNNLDKKVSLSDVMIVPSVISDIEHRSECNPYTENGTLPLFASPMDSVVSLSNMDLFIENGIIPILPRTETIENRLSIIKDGKWAAFSLDEFIHFFAEGKIEIPNSVDNKLNVLIDVANGHMAKIYKNVKKAKEIYGNFICIMVGNIANPETFRVAVDAGVDYVRCSIGTGFCCITSSCTAVHYPMASLISEINDIKKEMSKKREVKTKIVADGGMRKYSDIIKALSLGADYVMCGSMFSKMAESAAEKYWNNQHPFGVDNNLFNTNDLKEKLENLHKENFKEFYFKNGKWYGKYKDEIIKELKEQNLIVIPDIEEKGLCIGNNMYAKIYGMASREGQIAMNGVKSKTSEGITKIIKVEYNMNTWVENFKDFLRSSMSYTNSRTLSDFKLAKKIIISENAKNAINK